MPALRLSPLPAGLLALALFLAVTVPGLISAGFHPDDWRYVGHTPDGMATAQGRWAMHALQYWVLGQHFLLPLQIAVAAGCLLLLARSLAFRAAPESLRGPALLLVFAAGTQHPYMAEALQYDAHVAGFALALSLPVLALGVAADGLPRPNPARERGASFLRTALTLALAVQAVALGFGLYQPYPFLALAVPALILMRGTRDGRPAFPAILRALAVFAAGAFLYLVEQKLYVALMDFPPGPVRFHPPGLEDIARKLAWMPRLLRWEYTDSILDLPRPFRALAGLTALAALGLVLLAALRAARGGAARGEGLPRGLAILAGGAALLLVVPALFWFTYAQMDVPARTAVPAGFLLATAILASLPATSPAGGLLPRLPHLAGLALLALLAVTQTALSVVLWQDRARLSEGDIALARDILARVADLPGQEIPPGTPPFRIVAGPPDPALSWGGALGETVFAVRNPEPAIFRVLFGMEPEPQVVAASPVPCPAFPAPGSVLLHEGRALVCLSAQTGFLAGPATCVAAPRTDGNPDGNPEGGPGDGPDPAARLCTAPGFAMLVRPACPGPEAGPVTAWPVLLLADRDSGAEREVPFGRDSVPLATGGLCYTVVPTGWAAQEIRGTALARDGERQDWTAPVPRPAP